MPTNIYIFWVVFNLCFLAFTFYILFKVIFMEKRIKSLEYKVDNIYDKVGISIENGDEHYNSLCNHIQNNREIELDIFDEVRKD